MDEYIKRDGVLSKFNIDDMMNVNGTLISLQDARETISNFPASDVAPIRHGRWVTSSDRPDTIICTCCDSAFDVWKADIKRHHYCPNCGAKMDIRRVRGEEND